MKTYKYSAALLFSACIAGQMASADEATPAPINTSGSEAPAAPVANAKVLEVGGRVTIERMNGECRIVREESALSPLKIGLLLKPGDVLDLGTSCTMTIAVSGHKSVSLVRSGGRLYRLERTHHAAD